MAIFATAGSKFYIGGALDGPTVNAASFTSITWVEVKRLESLGSFGDTSEEVAFDDIGEARRIKLKGPRDAGMMEVVAAIDPADAGQTAVRAAEATPNDYAFRVVFNDAPVGGTPSERRFVGKVMSVAEALDTASSVMKFNMSIGVNSNVVRIEAAAGGG